MIGFIFKFSVAFVVSFLLLSFQFNDKPLFYHITEVIGPLGPEVQESINKSIKKSLSNSKKIGNDLFHNADPKFINDTVKSGQSAINSPETEEMILEEIKKEEVQKLDELINKH